MNLSYDEKHLSSFLPELIINIEKLSLEFAEKFPAMRDIAAFLKSNPQCFCKKKLHIFIEENMKDCLEFLESYFDKNPSQHLLIQELILKNSFYNVSGKIFEIDNNEISFRDFNKRMLDENFIFIGVNFCIDPNTNKIKIFFI